MKTILAAVDFSDVTDAVVEAVYEQASSTKAIVHVVHASVPEPVFVGYGATPVQDLTFHEENLKEEQAKLDTIVNRLKERGIDAFAHLSEGPAVDTLLDSIGETKAYMIVVGSHGHGALFNLVAGSVTQALLHKAKVPVLVVPSRVV
jgi:nucleotide-binding universal stress UspA family protein